MQQTPEMARFCILFIIVLALSSVESSPLSLLQSAASLPICSNTYKTSSSFGLYGTSGSLGTVAASSLAACQPLCDSTATCTAFQYDNVAGKMQCHLYKTANGFGALPAGSKGAGVRTSNCVGGFTQKSGVGLTGFSGNLGSEYASLSACQSLCTGAYGAAGCTAYTYNGSKCTFFKTATGFATVATPNGTGSGLYACTCTNCSR